jgi:triosephosphate isomerase (TIM)
MKRRSFIAGNWKMNGTRQSVAALLSALQAQPFDNTIEIAVFPPFVHLEAVASSGLVFGAQDVSINDNGAYTGEISANMLADMACKYVIIGHSERRQYHGESNEMVAAKAAKAIEAGLTPIICIGETLAQRQAGETASVIESQLAACIPANATGSNSVMAYEPVWAIGTGLTATTAQISEVHAQIRGILEKKLAEPAFLRIIYGGSVKPDNAQDILALADVDGALVGGASLKADQFLAIAKAAKG